MHIVEKLKLPRFDKDVFVAQVDGSVMKTMRTFYKDISRALRFPDYFEENLDSMYDCITSLEDIDNQEVVLVIKNYAAMLSSEKPAKRSDAIAVLKDAEDDENRTDRKKFQVFGLK